MNIFQKQLMIGDHCLAELAGQHRNGVGSPVPPAKVSVEEFEATQHRVQRIGRWLCPTCGKRWQRKYEAAFCCAKSPTANA